VVLVRLDCRARLINRRREEGRLAVVDLSGVHAIPSGGDPVGQLVYAAQSRDVQHVIIDGQVVMRNRRLVTLDGESSGVSSARARRAPCCEDSREVDVM